MLRGSSGNGSQSVGWCFIHLFALFLIGEKYHQTETFIKHRQMNKGNKIAKCHQSIASDDNDGGGG